MIVRRGVSILALLFATTVALAGCSSMRMGQSQGQSFGEPEQLQPVESSTVASSALPPIGADGSVQVANAPTTTGSIQTLPNGPLQPNPNLTGQPTGATPAPGTMGVAPATSDGSFVTLDSVGSLPNTPGRDLTGGLSVGKLLGGWTVISGPVQCRLNLTQTAKTGTSRYRASTPGCQLPQLAAVSSWQLAGSQVQLFDENGSMVAALILSGSRFIGTLSGGQGISMVG
jgi:hypothetical protein